MVRFKGSWKFPVLVLVLTLAAVGVVIALEQRTDKSRRSQLRIGSLRLALTDLQAAPFNADPHAGGSPTAARAQISADERTLAGGLSGSTGLATSGLMNRAAQGDLVGVEAEVSAIYAIATSRSGLTSNTRVPGLQQALTVRSERLFGLLKRIDAQDARRARKTQLAAVIGTAIAMLALMAMFLTFYVRAHRARTAAERLAGENEKLLGHSRVEASTDALTGIGNRRALSDDLEAQIAAGGELELLLAMFDLNGFKQYNDTFGHGAGDALLTRLGEKLSTASDETGRAYRMGGDEFCVLASCTPADAEGLLSRSESALSETGEGWSIDCAYGAVWIPSEATTPEDALQVADRRMYANKAGRSSASRQLTDVLLRVLAEQDKALDAHVIHVAKLASEVARELGLAPHEVERTVLAAKLHDVGKTAIPNSILNRPGLLTDHEWEFVYRHTLVGERIVLAAPSLAATAPIVRASHERFDGAGYPDRLHGTQIPVGARIIAVCDAFDAMTSNRPYRETISPAAALDELQACAGSQFDPEVVAAFVQIWPQTDQLGEPSITGPARSSEATGPNVTVSHRQHEQTNMARPAPILSQQAVPSTEAEVAAVIQNGARLAALKELGLLDTPAEEEFDRFTRLAADLLGVPVSLVSLVDADRQFFKSQQGLDGVWATARQTPLSHSFCQYAMASRQPFVVSDAREHPMVATNPAILDLGVVAYAGMPLVLDDGHAVGALCAIDHQPRDWSDHDLRILQDLAAAVTRTLDLRTELAHQGLYDVLTGLPNRALLVGWCNEFLQQMPTSRTLAVMCLGIDNFSQINQAFGADHADAALRTIGERLSAALRPSDVLGRLRGDIFTVCAEVTDEQAAISLCERLRETLASQPLLIGPEPLSMTATAGIAMSKDGSRGADLISEAAYAMRQAKRQHIPVQVSQDGWTELATARLQLQEALQGALDNGQISAVYQPIVDLKTGRTRGFETLTRWQHPDLGHISPGEFIPVAEATGQIIPIGEWILNQACKQLAQWREDTGEDLHITVNVAPPQLQQPEFAETAAEIIARAGLPGNVVTLEITEGVLLEGNVVQQANLNRLRQHGIEIALDDFGTGYSALSYLKRFPIDTLKIDRSFIDTMDSDPQDSALVNAILAMARALGLTVVAEGIETPEQLHLLQQLNCDYGQGYLFSAPKPAEQTALTSLLTRQI